MILTGQTIRGYAIGERIGSGSDGSECPFS